MALVTPPHNPLVEIPVEQRAPPFTNIARGFKFVDIHLLIEHVATRTVGHHSPPHLLGIIHMHAIVLVICHNHDIVAPHPALDFAGIGKQFVNTAFGIGRRGHGNTANGNLQLVTACVHP